MRRVRGLLAALLLPIAASAAHGAAPARPNIVVIMFDDLSPRLGAFGDPVARTPNLDALAREGIRYPNTFTTAPVCAPSRAALFSGRHQQTITAQHMRTSGAAGLPGGGPIDYQAVPPPQVKWLPELLRRAGYFTVNVGKTDYQIGDPFTIWDVNAPQADWRKRPKDKPFFAFINLHRTHESYIWPEDATGSPLIERVAERNRTELANKPRLTDPARVRVPPYLPDTPVVRADLARLYDNLAFDERNVGAIMAALKADGVLENTVVIATSDHGDGLPRMKRAIHDAGLRVPFIVRLPGAQHANTERRQLVSFVDLAPTILSLARAPIPSWMQGRAFLGPRAARPNTHVFAGADRFDNAPEWQRTVIDGRFQYIRNLRPDLPLLRPLPFRDAMPTMRELWRLHAAGALPPAIESYFTAPRPPEELYDLQSDPDTMVNLAADPRHAATLARLRRAYETWSRRTGDDSAVPEAAMVARVWPGMRQPATAAPTIRVIGPPGRRSVTLASATPGASIGWRVSGEPGWRLYTGPFALPPAALIEAKAIRYGYAESAAVQSR